MNTSYLITFANVFDRKYFDDSIEQFFYTKFNSNLDLKDFKKKNVLVLFQGQKNSGGYAIDIASVSNNDNTIVVKKSEIGPKKGEIATTVITTPYCIALIPKGNKLIIE